VEHLSPPPPQRTFRAHPLRTFSPVPALSLREYMRRIGRLSSELREAEPATPSSRQSVSPRRLPLVTSAPPPLCDLRFDLHPPGAFAVSKLCFPTHQRQHPLPFNRLSNSNSILSQTHDAFAATYIHHTHSQPFDFYRLRRLDPHFRTLVRQYRKRRNLTTAERSLNIGR